MVDLDEKKTRKSRESSERTDVDARSVAAEAAARLDRRIEEKLKREVRGESAPEGMIASKTFVVSNEGEPSGKFSLSDGKAQTKSDDQKKIESSEKSLGDLGEIECIKDEDGLAVAVAVEEEDLEYLPSAIEYDPDAKPMMYRNRHFRFYAALASAVLVMIAIGAVLAIRMTRGGNTSTEANVPYRERIVRERVESIIGSEHLSNSRSAYSKALEWIIHHDPIQAVPQDEGFLQRYVAASFYYATSVDRPWASCNPPETGQDDYCDLVRLQGEDSIYNSTKSANRWLSSHPVCGWAGVVCDGLGEVHFIWLDGSQMSGQFPEGIQHFPFLQSFHIGYGDLAGPLTSDLFAMKHLRELYFPFNSFTGTIPLPWWSSRSLQKLKFSRNSLTGSLPPEIRYLRDVKELELYDENSITGSLPKEIGLLKSCSFLKLNGNLLTGALPTEIGGFASIAHMRLDTNLISGEIPSEIGQLTTLLDLRIHENNMLGGTIPDEFYNLTTLARADMYGCNLTGTISSKLGQMTGLNELRLNSNNFFGEVPTGLGKMEQLRRLWLDGNDLVGIMPEEICDLRGFTQLVELQADCTLDETGNAELECDDKCCTMCCTGEGSVCEVN